MGFYITSTYIKYRIKKTTGGTANAGKRLRVLNSLIPKMLKPDANINSPPTIDTSFNKSVLKDASMKLVNKYIDPCQKNKTMAAIIIPIPKVDASTIEVMPSSIPLAIKYV